MRDYLEIGPTPHAETCEQLGAAYDADKARIECRAFAHQIERAYPPADGCGYCRTRSNPHDFGTYYEVACVFDDSDEEACDWAYRCEADADRKLEHWDAEALAEMAEALAKLEAHRASESAVRS